MLTAGVLCGHENEEAHTHPPTITASNLDEAVDLMLSERESPEALSKAIATARKFGATEQSILEARFLFHVDRHEDSEIAALLPDILKQAKQFRLSESKIFALEEDWLAVVEYVHAIADLEKGDKEGFKEHITEAFWLSPRQGAAFAPHIERLRLQDAMAKVRVDFALPLPDLHGQKTNIDELSKGKKAVLLHFFSPWSRECEESMPDFAVLAETLSKHDIAVITVIGDTVPEAIEDTVAILESLKKPAAGTWVTDNADKPITRLLRVQSVPTMVLLDMDGSVKFNGHPVDDGLWEALKKVDPECKRPELE